MRFSASAHHGGRIDSSQPACTTLEPYLGSRDAADADRGGHRQVAAAFFEYYTRLTLRGSDRGFTAGARIRW